jgi:4-amino-4-deoxy-L-arabinose transferase-like glycosyltransferase
MHKQKQRIFWLTFLVFVLAYTFLLVIFLGRTSVTDLSMRHLGGGDPYEYDALAKSLLAGEGFSNPMFGLRPPIIPLFVALIYLMVGHYPYMVVFFNVAFAALGVSVIYKLAYRLLGDRKAALIAAILLSFEAAHLDGSVTMMSESLHNLFLFIGLYWLTIFLQTEKWGAIFATALSMGLAMLTRPIAAYFAILMVGAILVYRRRLWRQAAVLLVLCLIPNAGWSFRNLYYVNNFALTTTGSYTTLFYKMVAVESHATGRSPEDVSVDIALEVERRLGNNDITREEIAEYAVGRTENLHGNSPERQQIFRDMVNEKVRAYPVWMVIMTGVSFVKQFDFDGAIPVPGWAQAALMVGYLGLGLVGYVVAWKERRYLFLLLSHLTIAYYAGTTAIVISGLYHIRYRTPYMPFILMYTALGAVFLFGKIRHRTSNLSRD